MNSERSTLRTIIDYAPFSERGTKPEWHLRGLWPAHWIHSPQPVDPPLVMAYRKVFALADDATIRVHVSGDERYQLFVDGHLAGRGSEFGDSANWYFETYDLTLSKGRHVIVALVWSLGELAPYAQMSVRHGFILSPQGEFLKLIGTGASEWECKQVSGLKFVDPTPAFGTGANLIVDGTKFPWGIETGAGDGWMPAVTGLEGTVRRLRNNIVPSHLMWPAELPEMIDREISAGIVRHVSSFEKLDKTSACPLRRSECVESEFSNWDLISGQTSVTIPPHTRRRVLFDLDDYYCAYPEVTTRGGAGSAISIQWAEALFNEPSFKTKGDRNAIEGKYFLGVGDLFKPDGGDHRTFRTLWWQAGRYVQVCVETSEEPLTIEGFRLRETRYPLEMESRLSCSDERLNRVIPLAFRSLQMCSHETFIDCPYYEQLMYSGDSRLKQLTTLVSSRDDRLLRKAIDIFDYSRTPDGLTQSRYPSRVRQVIAPFSLFWIGMVHDFALWRGDKAFIQSHLRGVRSVLESVLAYRSEDGLIGNPDGWNFLDWVPAWRDGEHPGMEYGPSGIINLQFAYTLQLAATLEEWVGEAEMGQRWKRLAREIAGRASEVYWDDRRGLFADDVRKQYFSEHPQCFAVLSGLIGAGQLAGIRKGLVSDPNLNRTTISFTHYLFETYRQLELTDLYYQRLGMWFDLSRHGFKTTPEQPEPTRSDCHGWSSHPIYHFFATTLGIRPASMGFGLVSISPRLGDLAEARGSLVHPLGMIEVDFRQEAGQLKGEITLPAGLEGEFDHQGVRRRLAGGGRVSAP